MDRGGLEIAADRGSSEDPGPTATGAGSAGMDPVARLFGATLHLTWSWMSPSVVRNYLQRANLGLGTSQYQALVVIAGSAPVRLRDVASGARMTASNASKIVTELVDAGLVTRRVPSTDRRVTLLEPTPAGREAVQNLEKVGRLMLAERLEGFEPSEVDLLGRLLERLAAATDGWTRSLEPEPPGDELDEEGEGAA
jgi:DNA-binding MarR family transcriptional regulator